MREQDTSVNPLQRRMLESAGLVKRPRWQRRSGSAHVNRQGVTSPALADEVGKRRLKAKAAKVARRRNR